MKKRIGSLLITVMTATGFPTSSLAADDASVKKDLFTVITLQGLPCGEVVSFTTKTDNDHMVVCRDGNRYHVYVNTPGRVVVEKQ
jgi:predicted double-glycine peptidase